MAKRSSNTRETSRYLDYLPAIYQEGTSEDPSQFLGHFLLAFERVLTGYGNKDDPGIEERLDGIPASGDSDEEDGMAGVHRYFHPGPGESSHQRAPIEFLEWLAGWVALTLREDWDEDEKRRILNEIVPAYRKRGTKAGLEQVLVAYTGGMQVSVSEVLSPFQVGEYSTVGVDTMIGGSPPHYFLVRVSLSPAEAPELAKKKEIIRAIIAREKPAHTFYDLQIELPTMQVGVTSEVGINTILGDLP